LQSRVTADRFGIAPVSVVEYVESSAPTMPSAVASRRLQQPVRVPWPRLSGPTPPARRAAEAFRHALIDIASAASLLAQSLEKRRGKVRRPPVLSRRSYDR
jgi:hypothetical protein